MGLESARLGLSFQAEKPLRSGESFLETPPPPPGGEYPRVVRDQTRSDRQGGSFRLLVDCGTLVRSTRL